MSDRIDQDLVDGESSSAHAVSEQEPDFLALEERIMFDGAMGAEAVDTAIDHAGDEATVPEPEADIEAAIAAVSVPASDRSEIYFVDAGVDNPDDLISAIPDGAEVVVLDRNGDGVAQMAAILDGRENIDAIHILSHGGQGQLSLGNTVLNETTMQGEHLDDLTAIGAALSADGDILIYGCDFSGGEQGLEAARLLGGITEADIAASEDPTGHSSLGGDWELETAVGSIQTETFKSSSWLGALAQTDTSIVIVDTGGVDDVTNPDRNDLTQLSIDYSNSANGELTAQVQLDETFAGGGNTINVSMIFDIDGDGNADYAYFVIMVDDNPLSGFLVVDSVELLDGSQDGSSVKLSGNTTSVPLIATTATTSLGTNPFNGGNDTLLTLTINTSEITANEAAKGNIITADDITMVNVSTHPSASATSNPSESVIDANYTFFLTDDNGTTLEDTAITIDVLGNDSTGVGSYSITTDPTNGTVTINADGTVTYTPNPNYSGTDSFVYTACSIDGTFYNATVTVEVTPDADAPAITATGISGDIDTVYAVPISNGLTDTDGSETLSEVLLSGFDSSLTFSSSTGIVTDLGSGTWSVSQVALPNLQVSGTNAGSFSGTASVTSTETSNGDTETVSTGFTVTLSDTGSNDAPVATPSTSSGDEDSDITVDLAGADVDGTVEAVTVTTLPPASEGVLYLADGTTPVVAGTPLTPAEAASLVFTPVKDFNGDVTIAFTVTDDDGATSAAANEVITVNDVNDDPVADDESFTTAEDTTSAAIDLLDGDTDLDGDTLAVQSIAGTTLTPGTAQAIAVTNGTVNVSATGVVTFTPDANSNGPVSFDYVVTDNNGGTDTGTVSGTVTAVNDDPVADDESFTTAEDTPSGPIDLLDGDTDLDGDTLAVQSIAGTTLTPGTAQAIAVTNGTVNVSATGVVTFTPDANSNGPVSFDYVVTDNNGGTDTGTVSGTVEPLPEGGTITASTAEDSPVAVNPLANEDAGDVTSVSLDGPLPNPATEGSFSYTDGTGATVTVSSPVTLTPAEAATLVFTPAPDFNGVVPAVGTTITDGNGDTATGSIAITVTPVNDPPVADDETFTVLQDSGATVIDVLDGDTDADGDALSITQVDGQAVTVGGVSVITLSDGSGTVTVDDSGAVPVVSFTPAAGYNGPSSFTYTIEDPSGATTTASVTGEVDPVAVPAALVADTPEDTAINVDPTEGQTLGTITGVRVDSLPLVTQGTLSYTLDGGGTVTLSAADLGGTNASLSPAEAASLTFTPVADFNGPVSDGGAGAGPEIDFTLFSAGPDVMATYDLTVTPVNDPPVADDETFTMPEDGSAVVIDVLAGDTDVDDPATALSVTEINGVPVGAGDSVDVGNGTATLNPDGTISFVPDADYNGPLSFSYTVSDPTGGTDTGTVSGTVEPLPEGGTITASTAEDSPVAVNPLANEDAGDVTSVSLDGPLPNPATEGSFSYTDGTGATVTVSSPVTLTPAEAATLVFTPAPDFNGVVPAVGTTITDGNGDTATGSIAITVTPVNDPPVADDESFTTAEDTTSAAIDLLDGDTDLDGDTLAVQSIAGTTLTPGTAQAIAVTNGTVNVSATGVVTFTPDANSNGPVSFDYVVTDNNGGTDTGTVSGTVTAVNDDPVADDESFTTAEDTPSGPIDLLDGDTDLDGDTLAVQSIAGTTLTPGTAQAIAVTNGTVNVSATGVVTFTPDANSNGPVSFDYVVTDNNGGTDTGTVSGTVEPLPEGGTITASTAEDSPVAVNPLANEDAGDVTSVSLDGPLPNPATEGSFSYTDGTGATVTVSSPVTLTPAEAATLVFTPAPDFNGVVAAVGTTITDGNGDTATGSIAITVTPVNDPPVADDETFTVLQDSGATVIDVLDGDTDADGDALSITQVDGQAVTVGGVSVITLSDGSGTVTVDDSGAVPVVSFTPAAGYNGPSSFTYTIEDPSGATTTASVTGEVDPVAVPAALVADTPEDTAINVDPTEGQTLGTITGVRVDSLPLVTQGTLSYTLDGGGTVTLSAADLGGTNASLSPAEAASLTFTPVADFNGPVSDGGAGAGPEIDFTLFSAGPDVMATYDLTVTPVNDPPVADDETFTMPEDGSAVVIDVLAGDTDVDDPATALSVTEINGVPVGAGDSVDVGNGTATLNPDGTISFVPDADYNGPLSFSYTVSDPTGGTDTGTVSGTVEPLPEGGTITASTAEDSPVAVNPLANEDAGDVTSVSLDGPLPNPATEGSFSYTDGTGATVTVSSPVTLTPAEAATLVFTPAPDFNGVVPAVGTTITDGNGDTATGSIAITVTPVNDPPVADDESFTTAEDTTSAAIDLLDGDTDLDGDTLAVQSIAGTTLTPGTAQAIAVTNGTVNVSATGVVTFTPDANSNGPVSFDYVVTDNNGGTDTGTVSGTVTAVNDDPVADDESFTTAEDTPSGPIDLLDGDTDLDGDTLAVQSIAGTTLTPGTAQAIAVTNGTVNVSATGVVTFTPDANSNGPVSFDYVVTDNNGGTDTGTVSGTVEPLPEGGTITASTAEDSPVAVNPLANEDAGDVTSVSLDGPLPNPATEGSFSYTDGTGATVTVSSPVTLTPAEAATLVFTPAPDFNGVVAAVGTTITDGNGDTATGSIAITVTPVNDPPVADDETFTVLQDSGATVIDVLDGDTDADGDALSITQVDGQAVTVGGVSVITLSDGSGTVTVDDSGAVPVVSFTPAAGYNGPSSFTYTIEDPSGATTTASVTGEVDPVAVPAALVADTPEDTAINVDPTEGQTLGTITGVRVDSLPLVTQGTLSYTLDGGGTVTLSAADLGGTNASLSPAEAASLTFTPVADFNGPVSDGGAGAGPEIDFTLFSAGPDVMATYDLTVTPVNDPPVADDETFTMPEDGSAVVIDVLAGDTDVDDPATALSVTEINGVPVGAGDSVDVGNGTATLNPDGTISFVPDADYNGPLSFSYTVSDPTGGTDTGTVSGTVEPLPEGGTITASTAEDSPVAVNPLANEDAGDVTSVSLDGPLPNPATEGSFSYTDGTGATVTVSSPVTLTPAEAATLVFTPAPDFNGVVPAVGTTITDGNGDTATGSIAITVTPVNDPPVADDESFTTAEDTTSAAIDLLDGDTDLDGDTLAVQSIAGTTLTPGTAQAIAVTNGTVNVSATGVVTFTPDANSNGPVSFDYVVTDNNGGTDTGTVSGTVTAVNDDPVADDESFTTAEDTPSGPIDLLDGDTDLDGDTLAVQSIAGTTLTPGTAQAIAVTNGTVNVSATGVVTFTPDANSNGPVSFDYVVTDNNGGTDTGTVSGTVTAVGENTGSITPSSDEFTERDEPITPGIIADPIVDLAAGDSDNLFSTPALMSDMNTGLGVTHPIITALNAIQSLDSTPNLSNERGTEIETIDATGAVSKAVNGIGFNRLFPGISFAVHDFEERLQQVLERQPAEFADFTTARGENLYFTAGSLDGEMSLQAFATSATGEALTIETINEVDTAGVSNAVAADESSLMNIHKSPDKALLDISLSNGYVVHTDIELYETGKYYEICVDAREIANTTFTAQTESLVFAKDAEASKLLKSIGG